MDRSNENAQGHVDGGGRLARLLEGWRRVELGVGLLLIAVGFVAVGLGWYDASGTGDVRRQLQALISGGFGGLALVVLGAAIVQSHVTSEGSRALEEKFHRIGDALLDLAYSEAASPPQGQGVERPDASGPRALTHVLASHASYHAPGCDLISGRNGLRELPVTEADAEDLQPCGICLPARREADA